MGPGQFSHTNAVLVKRIALKKAVGYAGMVDHFIGVHEFHGLETGNARKYGLAPPRVAGIEVGFNETGENF